MSYDTDKNRVKVARYRTRKGLKEAGYDDGTIADILAGVNWDVTTPAMILEGYTESDDADDSERPAPIARGRRSVSSRADTDEASEEATGAGASWLGWGILAAAIAGIGYFVVREVIYALTTRPSARRSQIAPAQAEQPALSPRASDAAFTSQLQKGDIVIQSYGSRFSSAVYNGIAYEQIQTWDSNPCAGKEAYRLRFVQNGIEVYEKAM
jgi:hypothetical protein